ncbi:hypothetical protein [Mycobacterium adipatum]|uniref:hypothetical protein n=1 Tax=Mycobacterium adipatum TaxID=1682113 RepID=UPI000ABE2F12|nr:hypothetical protein [Mycobacterium adipatum]
MSEDKTTELARRFVEAAWSNSGGYATLEALAAPEFSVKYSLMPAPIEGVEAYCRAMIRTCGSRAGVPSRKMICKESEF